jgi:predicted site-specific integrase-resolvase
VVNIIGMGGQDGRNGWSAWIGISSKTTLQKFRDEGRIRFAQPDRKIILYDRDSINEYLEKNAKGTF